MKEKGAANITRGERLTYWQGIIEAYRGSGLSGAGGVCVRGHGARGQMSLVDKFSIPAHTGRNISPF
ncbi:MAG: hypothetical protein DRG71_04685 [Deltaproteobacteria bacterium]|nr:MAG: hypothetical protein DRG71_04685 [Deltaproteobacteria bacterium]